ncbi:MAG: ferrochelatase, partial [Bauldia sp.]
MTDNNLPAPRALPPGHPPIPPGRIGVLLVNLGSPSGKDAASVRRYLRQFLSDPRVIEIWRPLWWLILNLVVLTTRPKKSAHAYAQVWNT